MGDNNDRFALRQGRQRGMNVPLRLGIRLGGRLIQNQNGRVMQIGARNGNALLLTTRQKTAITTNDGVVTMWKPHDAVVNAGGLCGLDDFFLAGLRIPQRNVIGHGVVGQGNVLEHDGYLVEQPLIAHLPNIQAIHLDRSGVHVVEPGD